MKIVLHYILVYLYNFCDKQNIDTDENNDCYLLDCDGAGILLDFPVKFQTNNSNCINKDLNNTFHHPSLNYVLPCLDMVDMCSLEAVLVSNVYSMLALPFLTERTEFNGKIYTTTPIFELGKLIMKDNVFNLHTLKTTIKQSTSRNQLNSPEDIILDFYTEDEMESCLSKISQNIKLGVYVTAISSGHSFGSCNWLIQNNDEKICYLAASSIFKTHAIPLQTQYMNNVDVLIVSQLSRCDVVRPDSHIQSIFELIVETIRSSGCVLFPIHPTGFVYDLIQFLSTYLEKENYPQIPIYCISSVITPSLAYSNISAEWLTNERLEVCYSGSVPFEHQTLIDKKRLICCSSLADLGVKSIKKPCIVLASNPFLMGGASRDLFCEWKNDAENCCIFTDPNYSVELATNQFEDKKINCHKISIDTRLSYLQLSNLIKDIKPQKVILSTIDYDNFNTFLDKSNTEITVIANNIIDLKPLFKYQTVNTKCNPIQETLYVPKEIASEVIIGKFANSNLDGEICFLSCYVEEKNGKLLACQPDNIEKPFSNPELDINGTVFPIGNNFLLEEFNDYLKKANEKIKLVEMNDLNFKCRFKFENDGHIDMDYSKFPIKFSTTENISHASFNELFQSLTDWLQLLSQSNESSEE